MPCVGCLSFKKSQKRDRSTFRSFVVSSNGRTTRFVWLETWDQDNRATHFVQVRVMLTEVLHCCLQLPSARKIISKISNQMNCVCYSFSLIEHKFRFTSRFIYYSISSFCFAAKSFFSPTRGPFKQKTYLRTRIKKKYLRIRIKKSLRALLYLFASRNCVLALL